MFAGAYSLSSSPTAITLAQITSSAAGDTFEKLSEYRHGVHCALEADADAHADEMAYTHRAIAVSRTLFVSYAIMTCVFFFPFPALSRSFHGQSLS